MLHEGGYHCSKVVDGVYELGIGSCYLNSSAPVLSMCESYRSKKVEGRPIVLSSLLLMAPAEDKGCPSRDQGVEERE